MANLPRDERCEQRGRDPEVREDVAREPAVLAGLRDRVHEQRQAARHQHRAGDVEPLHVRVAALLEQERRGDEGCDADRDVDEEDPLPAERVGEDAAEQHTCCGSEAADGTPGAERDVALTPFRERRRQNRECCGRDDRRAEALQGAGGDQRSLRPGKPGQQRCERKDHDGDEEHPPAAQEVRCAAAEEEETAEDECVGADHPLQIRLRETKVDLDRRQRDIHDRDVEDDHELDHAEKRESQPLASI